MTASEVFTNQASTTVSSGGTDAPSPGTVETWTVTSSASFPSASTGVSQFHVCDTAESASSEIIAVTNVSGTTWTVTRGAESTTPVGHASGFTIQQVMTAGFLGGLLQSPSSPLAGEVAVATGSSAAVAWGFGAGIAPSGDTSGSTDTANVQAVWSLNKVAPLQAGQYYFNQLTHSGSACGITGMGQGVTLCTWNTSGAAISFASNTGSDKFNLTGLQLTQSGTADLLSIATGGSTSRFPQLTCYDVAFVLGSGNHGGAILNGNGPTDSSVLADSAFYRCTFTTNSTARTVPAINLVSYIAGGLSNVTWNHCSFAPKDNEQYTVYLCGTSSTTSDNGYHANMSFRDCRWEGPYGGAIQSMSGRNLTIDSPSMWDIAISGAPATENSLISIGSNTGQLVSTSTVITNYMRYIGSAGNGVNASGPWDIEVDAESVLTKIDSASAMSGYRTTPAPVYLNFNGCPQATILNSQTSAATDPATYNVVNPPVDFIWPDLQSNDTGWTAADYGYAAVSFDPVLMVGLTSGNRVTGGQLTLIGLQVHTVRTVSYVDVYVGSSAPNSLVSGENLVGLYNSGGTLIASSGDQSTVWNSEGFKAGDATLTATSGYSLTLTPGLYWVGLLANGTASSATTPGFMYAPGSINSGASQTLNAGLTHAGARYAYYGSSQTTLPTSFSPTSTTLSSGLGIWVGLA